MNELPPQLILRPRGAPFADGLVLAEYDARHRHHIGADMVYLPAEERELAGSFRSEQRKIARASEAVKSDEPSVAAAR